jgi:hypothetical protein
MRTRTILALLALQLLAVGALAQSDIEFGRASSGPINAITKGSHPFSGSISLSQSSAGTGYGATFGGEVVKDRLWIFAGAEVLPRLRFSNADLTAIDAKATAHPVDWSTVTASFQRLQQPLFTPTLRPNDGLLPSSFLSLHSTTMLSDQMVMSFSFSRSATTRSGFDF